MKVIEWTVTEPGFPRELKSENRTGPLVIIEKDWKQPRCSSIEDGWNKLGMPK